MAKNCIENSKKCNNFHTGSKLQRIMSNNTKNRGFKVSKSISPFFRLTVLLDLAASRQVKILGGYYQFPVYLISTSELTVLAVENTDLVKA